MFHHCVYLIAICDTLAYPESVLVPLKPKQVLEGGGDWEWVGAVGVSAVLQHYMRAHEQT